MDKRETREYLGRSHHYNPSKNPQSPPKPSWWTMNMKSTQPMQIMRQTSMTSDGTSSPVGSPLGMSPMNFTRQLSRSYSSDDHKDSVLT